MNLSGTVLKGRYCILDPVGKGGGGKVYLARDLELGVLWAVKEIPLGLSQKYRISVVDFQNELLLQTV